MEIRATRLSLSLVRHIVRETWRGKSLARTLMNAELASVELTGTVLDLGSSKESASYQRFIRYRSPYTLTKTDYYQTGPGMVRVDLEASFPLPDASYDAVTCFNALEHVYDYATMLRETARVTKPDGRFIGGVPFLVNYHPDPHDYFRYTGETIDRLLSTAGFTVERVVAVGFGPLSVAAAYACIALPRWLRPFMVLPAVIADQLILRFAPVHRGRYPLGYVWFASKPGADS